MVGSCISDNALCQEAAQQELIRRYFKDLVEEKLAGTDSYGSDHIGVRKD